MKYRKQRKVGGEKGDKRRERMGGRMNGGKEKVSKD